MKNNKFSVALRPFAHAAGALMLVALLSVCSDPPTGPAQPGPTADTSDSTVNLGDGIPRTTDSVALDGQVQPDGSPGTPDVTPVDGGPGTPDVTPVDGGPGTPDTTIEDGGGDPDVTDDDGSAPAGTCQDKCGKYDSNSACQCDSGCKQYKDCCADYDDLCGGADGGGTDGGGACTADAQCDDKNPCTADTCVTGVCSHVPTTDACDDGDPCTEADTCADGACLGTAKACDDGDACTDDSCDKAKGCVHNNNTAACEDGDKCLEKKACKDGKCGGGVKKSCDDGDTCTTDSCDPAAGCIHKPVDGKCDDGDMCTADDACKGGKCTGTAKDCADADPCTDDVCDPKTAKCDHQAAADATPCDDGDGCTAGDACTGGTCAGKAKSCDDGNACTTDACDAKTGSCDHVAAGNGDACDDGNPCTDADKCNAGVCKGTGKDCDDNDPCTVDTCDGATKKCSHSAATDGSACDDGNKCNVNAVCTGGKCAGVPKVCDDKNSCTKDACDAKTGKCTHGADANGAACDDGDPCTSGDKCASGKCAGKKLCDDNNPCTDDVCDPKTGACSAKAGADGAACDDGDKCSTKDACKAGKCVGLVNTCNDGEPCTTDLCDASTGKCSHKAAATGTPCDDGNACTGGEKCTSGKCGGGSNVCTFKTVWKDDIDCAKAADWKAMPVVGEPATGWHVDGTPAAVKPKTGKCTVNFNNGKDYSAKDSGGKAIKAAGQVTRSGIKVPDGASVRLVLQSWHDVESSNSYDHRYVELSSDAFKKKVQSIKQSNSAKTKTWTKVTIDLDAWKGRTIAIRLRFDSVDGVNNSGTGWFIDDLAIEVGTANAGTCKDKCGKYDSKATCQCDSGCAGFGDCCADYKALCVKCTLDSGCDDGDACTVDTCDKKTGKCLAKAAPDGTGCNDGDACTSKDACAAGTCKGAPTSCDDGNDCTWDFCDKLSGCQHSDAVGGCDDGDPCTTKDTCSKGKCAAGTAKCDDGNSCTKDICDAKTGACKADNLTDGTACEDGDKCTANDACSGGKCAAGKAKCDDDNPCTTDACDAKTGACKSTPVKDGTGCNDANACTVATICTKGKCAGKNVCTYSALLQDTFECGKNAGWTAEPANKEPALGWHIDGTPNPPGYKSEKCSLNFNNGKNYDNGSKAALGKVTSAAITLPATGQARLTLSSYHGVESGSDGNQYDHRRIQVSDDGFKKSLQSWRLSNLVNKKTWEKVTIQLGSWAGKKIQVRFDFDSADGYYNDGPGWFIDDLIVEAGQIDVSTSCVGRCGKFVAGAKCQCSADCAKLGNCCKDYKAICTGCKSDAVCDDGNPCTTDKCDTKTGACTSTGVKDGATCDDGNACSDKDTCTKGSCGGEAKKCTDGNVCTYDSCDPIKGCVFPSNSAKCDDGNLCTVESVCNNGKCLGAKQKCNDNKPCTSDSCDSKTGKCTYKARPDGSACSTGDACLLGAKCKAGVCAGKKKDCHDGNACTVDACDAKTGKCSNAVAKDGTACVDGNACTANDVCTKGKCAGKDACTYKKVLNVKFPCGTASGFKAEPAPKTGQVGWLIDATPKTPKAKSPTCSLNFNDGKDFSPTPAARVAGVATSAAVSIGATGHARLSFWSWHDTETNNTYDQRKVLISDDGFKSRVQVIAMANQIDPKKWVQHHVQLDGWLGKKIQVRFSFDSIDGVANTGAGWFIDDLVVEFGTVKAASCGKDSQCDDGNACTVDTCNKDGACANSFAKSDAECSDGEACTWDWCDPKSGCKHANNIAPCDDGNACTTKDACKAGKCAGQLKVCDDKNSCTADSCDPKAGGCKFAAKKDGTLCTDGKVCTLQDACKGGKCVGGKGKCDDGKACTTDSCDAKTGACSHKAAAEGSSCDDGNACTATDACKKGVCIGVDKCTKTAAWSDKVDCGAKGWTFDPAVKAGTVGWAIDGTPNPPGYKSAKCSLNFNNGKNFNVANKKVGGAVVSAKVKVPTAAGAALGLWSYNGVEEHTKYDNRYVEVSDDGFVKNIESWRLSNSEGKGKWLEISRPLDKWMGKSIQIRLRFDSGDAIKNDGKGWFVDDLAVYSKKL